MPGGVFQVKVDEIVCRQQIEPVAAEEILIPGNPLRDRPKSKSFKRMDAEVDHDIAAAERVAQYVLLIELGSRNRIVRILTTACHADRVGESQRLTETLFQVVVGWQVISFVVRYECVRRRCGDRNLRVAPYTRSIHRDRLPGTGQDIVAGIRRVMVMVAQDIVLDDMIYAGLGVEGDVHPAVYAFLGEDLDHTVRTPRAIKHAASGAFNDLDMVYDARI